MTILPESLMNVMSIDQLSGIVQHELMSVYASHLGNYNVKLKIRHA